MAATTEPVPPRKGDEGDPIAEMWRWRPTDRDLGARITLVGIGLLVASLVLVVAGAVRGRLGVVQWGGAVAMVGAGLGIAGTRLRIERFAARLRDEGGRGVPHDEG